MLFPYKFVQHNIARLQDWIDFLFLNVWCNAKQEYSLELLNNCPELKKIAEAEAYKEDPNVKAKDYITGPIVVIYDLFKDELTQNQRKQIKRWYKRSRRLDYVYNNEYLFNPISKTDIGKYSKNLAKELYLFYTNLFDHALDLVAISNKNGTVKNHYNQFIKINNSGVCPFCGISPLRSHEMPGHEAYDHYLPKENFPTYSINFKNLVPTCHDCNSIHKLRQIPILTDKKIKRRAFNPYSKNHVDLNFKINVKIKDYTEFGHGHIEIDISSTKDNDKVNTWLKVYNIYNRYKDQLTNEGTGKYWLVEFIEELPPEARERELTLLSEKLKKSKFKNKNFLKVPFIIACRDEGLLNNN